MVVINLLPWRENKRRYQIKIIKKISGISIFLHIILVCGWCIFFAQVKQRMYTRLSNLESQIKESNGWQLSLQKLNDANKANALNDGLIRYRAGIWQLFSLLQKNSNKNICFTQIKRTKNNYLFIGKARSIIDLMLYLNHWNAIHLFSSVAIFSLEQHANTVHFRIVTKDKNNFSWPMLGTSFA